MEIWCSDCGNNIGLQTNEEYNEIKRKLELAREAISQALLQKNKTYGMGEMCGSAHRERKVFSLLEECLEEIGE